jgi:preprotein translocase subunit SecG
MQTILIVIHLFVAIALTVVVLLQKSEGGALGMGGGGSGLGGFFSPRGAASTLTRTTAVLGLLFFLTSLALTWLALSTHETRSILDSAPPPATTAPATPLAPPRQLPSAPAPAPQQPAVPPSH